MDWFWHVLLICVVVIPVTIMWLAVIIEIATRRDLRWWQRVAWILLALAVPLIGALIYLIYTWATAGRRAPGPALPRSGGQSSNASDPETELSSLDSLRRSGVLTEAEFEAGKRRVLEGITPDGMPSATQRIDETPQATATDREPKHGA